MAFSMAAEIVHDIISQKTKEALNWESRWYEIRTAPIPGKSKLEKLSPKIGETT